MHASLSEKALGLVGVPFRPGAPPAARRESLPVGSLVAAAGLAVDPAVTERFVEGLVVGETRGLHRALLREHQPDAVRLGVMLAQPSVPRHGITHDELGQFDGHGGSACHDASTAFGMTESALTR